MTRSDAELLRAHLAGDRAAYPELFRRYQSALWWDALRTLQNREDADDAVQDTLLRAHLAAANCTSGDSVWPWLRTILRNICLDRHRRAQTRAAEPVPDEVLERLPAPRNPIVDHEERMDVSAALAQLPLDQGRAIFLVELAGYPVSEAADLLGVAAGTVKSRGWRGRKRFAELYRGDATPTQPVTEER
ncbi:MAG TPA: sigma-70 family RNA polymerase sigma factor [Pseudonocardia sp.]|nr:sigma-70 family RNA polymerase sigma factor [Pseudonocardia sp.]